MRAGVLIGSVLTVLPMLAQDNSRVAPPWAIDLFLGGGSEENVTVRTGPDRSGTFDLAGWIHLGIGVDRRIAGRWSGRFTFGYESGGWEATGTANPFAAPSNDGDRWAFGAGAVCQVYRGARSQFNVYAGARLLLGMDVPCTYELDSSATPSALRDVKLHYQPSAAPVVNAGWRWRVKRGAPGCIGITWGITYFHCTYHAVDLPNDLPALPTDLLPLTGAHGAWHTVFTLGYSGIQ